jgi:DNA-binding response OmpR family regulator
LYVGSRAGDPEVVTALERMQCCSEAVCVLDLESVWTLLSEGQTALPSLMILDVSTGDQAVASFMQRLNANGQYKQIPIVLFGDPADRQSVADYFGEGIASYMVRPDTIDEYLNILKAIDAYWTLSLLPNRSVTLLQR